MARTDSVAVPELEAAERCRTVLKTDLVDEHLRRGDDPRQVPRRHVAHLADERACTPPGQVFIFDPQLRTSVETFAVRISCTFTTLAH